MVEVRVAWLVVGVEAASGGIGWGGLEPARVGVGNEGVILGSAGVGKVLKEAFRWSLRQRNECWDERIDSGVVRHDVDIGPVEDPPD